MKEVTLYTVEEQKVIVGDRASFVSYFRKQPLPDLDEFISAGDKMLYSPEIGRIDVPVRKFVRDEVDDKLHYINRIEYYVAIDPELEEMITSAARDRIAELERENRAGRDLVDQYETRIDQYNSLPWYKRIFKRV